MKKKYKKLKGYSSLAYQKLYLAEDHLMVVDGWIAESYRRLYFPDIQAITLCRTRYYKVANWLLGICFVIGLIPFLANLNDPTLALVIGSMTVAPFLLALVINLFKGPSCIMQVKTGVQDVKLRCVSRRRRAGKILNRIVPLITAAQGAGRPLNDADLVELQKGPATAL